MIAVTQKVRADPPTVNTPLGHIRGVEEKCKQTSETVFKFKGIPYGKPPVGDLRFRNPVPVDKWTGTLDATSYGAGCPQHIPETFKDFAPDNMSEDCLFLNVYVPNFLDVSRKLPVMVWIHGGALMVGYSNQYDGGWIATSADVIVVAINYRLDALGFLALDHPAALGNYGLWDQKLALQWVHDNIESFGGDSNTVTIFGESAGGWSVNFMTLIPSNGGLFQRAIAQSGTINQINLAPKQSKLTNERLINFAAKTQCPLNNMYKFVDCLRDMDYTQLLDNTFGTDSKPADSFEVIFLPHSPVVDGLLFETDPLIDLENSVSEVSKFFHSIDFITGYTSNELITAAVGIPHQTQKFFAFNATESLPANFLCEGVVKPIVKRYYNNDFDLKEKLCDFYTTDSSQDEQSMKTLTFMNDVLMVSSTHAMLEKHISTRSRTYQYMFSIENEIGLFGARPKYAKGCAHAEELQYMFEAEVMLPSMNKSSAQFTEEEKRLSANLIKYFTSFAKSG